MDSDLGASLIGEKPMAIQEKFRIAVLISKAALHFWTAIDGLDLDNQDKQTVRTEEADNVGSKYYCHQCNKEVATDRLDVNMPCPLCQGGFIEESASDADRNGGMVISYSDQIVLEVVESTNGSVLNTAFLTNQASISHVSRSASLRLSPGASVGLNQPTPETRVFISTQYCD